jgi:hypothetical protein
MPYRISGTVRRYVSGPADGSPSKEHASFVVEVSGGDKETAKEIEAKVAHALTGLDRGLAEHRKGIEGK